MIGLLEAESRSAGPARYCYLNDPVQVAVFGKLAQTASQYQGLTPAGRMVIYGPWAVNTGWAEPQHDKIYETRDVLVIFLESSVVERYNTKC